MSKASGKFEVGDEVVSSCTCPACSKYGVMTIVELNIDCPCGCGKTVHICKLKEKDEAGEDILVAVPIENVRFHFILKFGRKS